jgi:hypothetical protein
MSRVLLAMGATLVLMALVRALPVVIGVAALPVTPAAIPVAWAALTLAPLEAVVAASLCGLVVDALGGLPVGLSSFSLVVALLVTRLGIRNVMRPVGPVAAGVAGIVGLLQALVSFALLLFFAPERAPWQPTALVASSVLDVGLAWVLLPVLDRLGVLVGLERTTSTAERLASRL